MLIKSRISPQKTADRPVGLSALRGIETEVLLQAVTALRLDGTLSEAEFQAKRRQLAAEL